MALILKYRRAEPDGGKLSLHEFIRRYWQWVDPAPFVDGWHIGAMCEYLEALTAHEIDRLIINVPPGHQKSLTVSVFWPAWCWSFAPALRFLFTAYRGDLALRDADRARELIRSEAYQQAYGGVCQLRSGQDVKSRYANTSGGYRFSTAVNGIMGEGGDFVAFDDPHNVQQAESDEVRDETVRLIRLALPTRIRSKNGGVVVMMQRLHERDYCGVVLAEETGWTHLCLPGRVDHGHKFVSLPRRLPSGRLLPGDRRIDTAAVVDIAAARTAKDDAKAASLAAAADDAAKAAGDDLLFPGLFGPDRMAAIEAQLSEYGIAGQIQQRPVPRSGGMFKREWFAERYIDVKALPRSRVVVRGWDLAGSTRKTSPYSAGVRMSVDAKRTYYIEHVVRIRASPGDLESAIVETAKADGLGVTIDVPQDPGQAGKSQVLAFAKTLAGFVMRASPESGSKEQRAEAFAAQCERGNVYVVRGDWTEEFVEELCLFPAGTYKDQVDATSRAFARLLQSGGMASAGVSSGSY